MLGSQPLRQHFAPSTTEGTSVSRALGPVLMLVQASQGNSVEQTTMAELVRTRATDLWDKIKSYEDSVNLLGNAVRPAIEVRLFVV